MPKVNGYEPTLVFERLEGVLELSAVKPQQANVTYEVDGKGIIHGQAAKQGRVVLHVVPKKSRITLETTVTVKVPSGWKVTLDLSRALALKCKINGREIPIPPSRVFDWKATS